MPSDIVPHFDYPFRFAADGHIACNDQDTHEDVLACCVAILLTPLGFRIEQPDFGTSEILFDDNIVNTDEIRVALDMWEDRAHTTLESTQLSFDQLARYVKVKMEARNP